MGKNFFTSEFFVQTEYQEALTRVKKSALSGESTANFELPFQTKIQETRQLLINATARRDATGNVCGIFVVAQDITEKKRDADELEKVARDLRALIDKANTPIWGVDKDGNVNEWNDKAASLTKFSQEEVMGRNLVDVFITEEYKESVKTLLDNALNGMEASNFEFPLYTKDKIRVEVLLNATTRRDKFGNIVGVVGVGQDITERKKAEGELER
eukprot:37699-Pyramimonas_sp.AAC.1